MPKISVSGQLFSVVDPFTGEPTGQEYRAGNAGRAARRAYFCMAREETHAPESATTPVLRRTPELTDEERKIITERLAELRAQDKIGEEDMASYLSSLGRARFSTRSCLLGIRKHGTVPVRSYLCYSAPILRPSAIEVQKLCMRKSVARFVTASALSQIANGASRVRAPVGTDSRGPGNQDARRRGPRSS